MHIRLPLLLCGLALAAAPATSATRNFGVSGFDRIRVDAPVKVVLTTGVPPRASASGSARALDGVSLDVHGRTLVVKTSRSPWGGYPGEQAGPIEVRIGTHELSAVWLNGSGSLDIDKVEGLGFELSVQGSGVVRIANADVDQMKVSVAGSAAASIAGKAGTLTAIVRGVSSLDAAALVTKDATLGAEGAATLKAHVTNAAKVDASGPAAVTLTGRPACTTKLSGSAEVVGCR